MADTLYGIPVNSLTSKDPESSDQVIMYDDNEKQAHVTTVGNLTESMNGNISDAFSSSKSYEAGDYCIYNDTLYKFTNEHSGAWDNEDVEAVTVGQEIKENTDLIDSLDVTIASGSTDSSITIPANSSQDQDVEIAIPDGYKYDGVVRGLMANSWCYVNNLYRNRSTEIGSTVTITVSIRNFNSSSASGIVYAYVLVKKLPS